MNTIQVSIALQYKNLKVYLSLHHTLFCSTYNSVDEYALELSEQSWMLMDFSI